MAITRITTCETATSRSLHGSPRGAHRTGPHIQLAQGAMREGGWIHCKGGRINIPSEAKKETYFRSRRAENGDTRFVLDWGGCKVALAARQQQSRQSTMLPWSVLERFLSDGVLSCPGPLQLRSKLVCSTRLELAYPLLARSRSLGCQVGAICLARGVA